MALGIDKAIEPGGMCPQASEASPEWANSVHSKKTIISLAANRNLRWSNSCDQN